jgi:hypothetical protein
MVEPTVAQLVTTWHASQVLLDAMGGHFAAASCRGNWSMFGHRVVVERTVVQFVVT